MAVFGYFGLFPCRNCTGWHFERAARSGWMDWEVRGTGLAALGRGSDMLYKVLAGQKPSLETTDCLKVAENAEVALKIS